MSKKKELICNICKKVILNGEAYCTLTEYYRDWTEKNIGHYHVYCFRDKFMIKQDQAQQLLVKTNKLIDNFSQRFA